MKKNKTLSPSPRPHSPEHNSAAPSLEKWAREPLPQVMLFAAAAATFSSVIFHDFVYFDDHEAILNNPALQKPSFSSFFGGQNLGMYAPLTWIFYWVGQSISGKEAWGVHLLSVLLHAGNAVLLYQLLFHLLRRPWPAIAVALLFAVHPIQTEAIAWAASQSALLFTAFYLGSWLMYVRWIKNQRAGLLGVSILLFLLACLAKSAAVSLPIMLIVCDWLFFSKQDGSRSFRQLLVNKVLYLLPALAFGLYTFSTRAQESLSLSHAAAPFSMLDRFWMVSQTILFYPLQLFLPFHYSVSYPFVKTEGMWPLSYYVAPLVLLGMVWAVWRFWRKQPEYLFALALYIVPLSLMLPWQTIGKFELCADRYVYLSCAGIFLLLMLQAEQLGFALRNGILIGTALVMAFFAQRQIACWKNDVVLFRNCVEQYQEASFCQCNLAYSLMKKKDYEAAIEHYTEAMRQDPETWQLEVYNGRGLAYLQLKKIPEALADFNNAVRIGMRSEQLLLDRGRCFTMLKRFSEAIPDFDQCVAMGSKNPEVYFFRGFCIEKSGDVEKAVADYSKAIALRPDYLAAVVNRGFLYQNTQNFQAALTDYNTALQIDPTQAMVFNNRASVYLGMNQAEKALQDVDKALQINPDYGLAKQTRAKIMQALGRAE